MKNEGTIRYYQEDTAPAEPARDSQTLDRLLSRPAGAAEDQPDDAGEAYLAHWGQP